jgi:alkylation response protein AidB-like acyl-CoA dehydrogenase
VTDAVARARALAEELLFPAAAAVDAAGTVPRGHLDALADAGLYGLTGPADAGGLAAGPATAAALVAQLGG